MWKKTAYKSLFLSSAIIVLISSIVVFILRNFLPPKLPLYYGRPVGENQLAGTLSLLIPLVFSFLLTIVNLAVVNLIKDDFLKKILAVSTFVLSILAAITVFKIMALVNLF